VKVEIRTLWPADFSGLRVVQMNSRPSKKPEFVLSENVGVDGSTVGVWAPSRASGLETQTDVSSWKELIESYRQVFQHAVGHKTAKLCMPALGSTLYWPAVKTALAARTALSSFGGSLDGLVVMFVVKKKDARTWLDELACFDAVPIDNL